MDLKPNQGTPTGSHSSSVVTAVALFFLSINTGVALFRALRYPWTVCFVLSAYTMLLLLYWCVGAIEKVPPSETLRRWKLKLMMWVLATALNLMFAYQVSKFMPLALSLPLYALAGSVTVFSFVALFVWENEVCLLKEHSGQGEEGSEEPVVQDIKRRQGEIGSQLEKQQLIVC